MPMTISRRAAMRLPLLGTATSGARAQTTRVTKARTVPLHARGVRDGIQSCLHATRSLCAASGARENVVGG